MRFELLDSYSLPEVFKFRVASMTQKDIDKEFQEELSECSKLESVSDLDV